MSYVIERTTSRSAAPDQYMTITGAPRSATSHAGSIFAIPSDQLYFWSAAWQAGENESAVDREAGAVARFSSARDAISWLLDAKD